jgi:hypothetical protein
LNDNSARLSVVFTDWPPGPEDLENRQKSSSVGITMPRALTSMVISLAASTRPDRYLSTVAQWDRGDITRTQVNKSPPA